MRMKAGRQESRGLAAQEGKLRLCCLGIERGKGARGE